jgi:hypothetical protein
MRTLQHRAQQHVGARGRPLRRDRVGLVVALMKGCGYRRRSLAENPM